MDRPNPGERVPEIIEVFVVTDVVVVDSLDDGLVAEIPVEIEV